MDAVEVACEAINPDGIIMLEHSFRDRMPDRLGDMVKQRDKKYGGTLISIYRKETT
jgi:16S rRNA G966 N2-methylase RsmD